MKLTVPHNTSKSEARNRIEKRLQSLLSQFGQKAEEIEHEWLGDRLSFRGKAKGLKVEGTVDVTDDEVIIHGKLPFLALPFEPKIRAALEKETDQMFRA